MSTQPKVIKRQVALGLEHLSVAQMIADGNHYVLQMTGNVHFPSPTPTLAAVTAQVNILDAAYHLAQTKVKGSVTSMHLERKTLHSMLKGLGVYAETMANADPVHAELIIQSAGMPEKKPAVHLPKIFSAKNGKLKGTAVLNNKAVKGSTYIYQMTTDLTNANGWVTIYSAGKVKFTMTGLTSGTKYHFRTAIATKGVQGNWSDAIELLVA